MSKITFQKYGRDVWFAESGENEICIEKFYFGLSHWYQVYINDKLIGQEDKLNTAKELARREMERRAAKQVNS